MQYISLVRYLFFYFFLVHFKYLFHFTFLFSFTIFFPLFIIVKIKQIVSHIIAKGGWCNVFGLSPIHLNPFRIQVKLNPRAIGTLRSVTIVYPDPRSVQPHLF